MKKKHLTQFVMAILSLIALNWFARDYFFRIDLTEEQRYSISPATKQILRDLEDPIVVKVYLEGRFPAGFQRLQKTIKETLAEFKRYAGSKLSYRFVDPSSQGKNEQERDQFYRQLDDKGVKPIQVFDRQGDQRTQNIIFPGALISYYDREKGETRETAASLFKVLDQRMQQGLSSEQILNQSVENVEYNLISTIKFLTSQRKRVGLIEGHGELENIEMATAITRLQEYYEVVKIPLTIEPQIRAGVDAIIIAKPDSTFSEEDKYKIDQYIMKGGKALFFVDVVGLHMDSVLRDKGAFTFPIKHNLLDMFFRYGVRLNANLIKDLNATPIPIVVGNLTEDQPNVQAIPWQYYPIINNFPNHPIVKNLGPITSQFVSTIDTIKSPGIRKIPLMFTSQYTQVRTTPTYVRYEEERQQPDPAQYQAGPLPVAFLLEGKFNSVYQSRSFSQNADFVAQSPETKILVCSDGDLIRNEIDSTRMEPKPLGYNPIIKTTFANADFLISAVDYMIDDQGVIQAKNKEITLRPLDKLKLKEEKAFWQWLNTLLPILLVVLFGGINFWWRKRKYQTNT